MVVLFRVVNRQVERIRVFSEDCALDAGGREITWLTGVRPAESVALLESLVAAQTGIDRRDRVIDGAITRSRCMRMQRRTPAWSGCSPRLSRRTSGPRCRSGSATRGRGASRFWEDRQGRSVDRGEEEGGVRHFAEPETGAVDILIDNARNNTDTSVRGESIFWLAQKAGNKAAAAITERIDQDPDTEVKKKAVFALSQLPKDEGVPLLINVARTHTNPAVRKQAMFWLGQSKDPRAVDFFAEILK